MSILMTSESGTPHSTIALQQFAQQLQNTVDQRSHYLFLRRVCDVLIVILVTVPSFLVVALAAIAIHCTMGRPVFFVQDRIGLRGKVFRMVKLRTMTNNPQDHIGATLPGDRRITRVGQLLRNSHIDELPQLWNIWRGDMSLLGPRPEQPHLANLYREVIPNYSLRNIVRPGLSGYAQVYFGYAANLAETRTKLKYDLYYIQHIGPLLDLRIVFRTILLLVTT